MDKIRVGSAPTPTSSSHVCALVKVVLCSELVLFCVEGREVALEIEFFSTFGGLQINFCQFYALSIKILYLSLLAIAIMPACDDNAAVICDCARACCQRYGLMTASQDLIPSLPGNTSLSD